MKEKGMYDNARMAIRNAKDPMAFLRLGDLYAKGIGTLENHTLACYFYEKALFLGCQEAESIIEKEYDTGKKSKVRSIFNAMGHLGILSPSKIDYLRRLIEKERIKKNYGILSSVREHLPFFYPDYNEEKAHDDILNDRDTIDADICHSLSTTDNQSEFFVDQLEHLLEQLFAPVTRDVDLCQKMVELSNYDILVKDEHEYLQAIVNLRASYHITCQRYNVEEEDIYDFTPKDVFPYMRTSLIPLWRKQALKSLLSIRGIDSLIEEYLDHLDSDNDLLDICDKVKDQDLQLFLISVVEMNIDAESLLFDLHTLLKAYRDHRLEVLAEHLNAFAHRLTDVGFGHLLPEFTPDNLPPIIV